MTYFTARRNSAASGSRRRKFILIGAPSLLALALADPAAAQTSDAQTIHTAQAVTPQGGAATADTGKPSTPDDIGQDIIVTGLRGSLQRNLDIKRSATGVVDAISSK
ncbi:hypothetical protein, partial [Escherichia coli]|uniref:hypothetical protein n=1 Tax=Escherichia coli TaxID=562 RepID=UPI003D36A198